MATRIILTRKSEMTNKARAIKFMIDGTELSKTVASGGSEEYEVGSGMHTLQCKINWCKSPELTVNVNEGETKFLKVKTAMRYYLTLYVVALLAVVSGLLFRFAKIPQPEHFSIYQLILVTPFILYNLYYLVIAKNKYLVLEEDKGNMFN